MDKERLEILEKILQETGISREDWKNVPSKNRRKAMQIFRRWRNAEKRLEEYTNDFRYTALILTGECPPEDWWNYVNSFEEKNPKKYSSLRRAFEKFRDWQFAEDVLRSEWGDARCRYLPFRKRGQESFGARYRVVG